MGRPPLPSTLAGLHRCMACKQLKPLTEFYRESRRWDGYGYRCKPCHAEINKAKYHEQSERVRERRRRRYWSNREEELARQAKSREKNGHKWKATKRAKHVTDPAINMLATAKARAKRKGLEFDLSLDDIIVPELCPVLGIPLRVGDKTVIDSSPSLERIDNTKGYIKGNVIVVSFKANTIKNSATIAELAAVVRFYDKLS